MILGILEGPRRKAYMDFSLFSFQRMCFLQWEIRKGIWEHFIFIMKPEKILKTIFPGFTVQRTNLIVCLAKKVIQDNDWKTVALEINRKHLIKYFNNIKLLSLHKKRWNCSIFQHISQGKDSRCEQVSIPHLSSHISVLATEKQHK